MSKVFNNYSKYYDLLYQDKDYLGEIDYIHELIKKYHPTGKKIIEFGSGTGKHANLLALLGYHLLGIEPSESMLKIATERKHPNVEFQQANLQNFSTTSNYDIALALFHVISYVNTNNDLLISFKKIYQQLNPGGIFIFDIWYTPAVLTQIPENRTKVIEDNELKIERVASPIIHWNTNIIDVNYNVKIYNKNNGNIDHFKETHQMRHFGIPEIELLTNAVGFEILCVEEFFSRKIPGNDTWGVCFVLKKTNEQTYTS